MPEISFKFTNTAVSQELQALVHAKFSSLDKYLGDEPDVRVEVEFQKETASQSGDIFRVEGNLWCHGKLYRADASMKSFEMAVDEVRAELDKELRRSNKKRESLMKRGGRKIKEMLRFG